MKLSQHHSPLHHFLFFLTPCPVIHIYFFRNFAFGLCTKSRYMLRTNNYLHFVNSYLQLMYGTGKTPRRAQSVKTSYRPHTTGGRGGMQLDRNLVCQLS